MNYSSLYRSKIIVWAVLMIVILVGARAFAAWDAGIVIDRSVSVVVNT